jgi:hypothetical protein
LQKKKSLKNQKKKEKKTKMGKISYSNGMQI